MKRVEKFLMNPEFVRWVKNSDENLDSFWNKWIEAHPESLPHIRKAKEIILGINFKNAEINESKKSEILKNILKENSNFESLKEKPKSQPNREIKKSFWRNFSPFYRIAAILTIFSVSVLLFYQISPSPSEKTDLPSAYVEKSTSAGEKLHLTLPDGSEVWLNSESKITFPKNFGEDSRNISLQGEGFFEVMKDTLRPFSVNSNGIITKALGTSFNINTAQNHQVQVSLVTGKVQVLEESNSSEYILLPGQQLDFNLEKSTAEITKFSVFNTTAWKDGILVFNNSDLDEVVRTLERWYGVDITLVNSKNVNWSFTGEYKNQMLENVLNSMAYVEEFEYDINGKNVELKF